MTFTIRAGFSATIALAAFLIGTPARAQDLGITLGTQAPAVVAQALDGKTTVDLGQYLGKSPVLIEFWATWCPNCKELEPTMKAAYAKYGTRVKFIGVSVAVNQTLPRVKAYITKYGIPGEQFWDAKGDATDKFDVPATSYVVIIDKSGKVVYTGLGGTQDLDAALKKVL